MLLSQLGKVVLGGAVAQATSSIRAEIAATRLELTTKVKSLLAGVGLLAFAVGLALFAIGFLAFAGVIALSEVWPMWLSALVVGGVLLIGASIVLMVGLKKIRRNSDLRPERMVAAYRRFSL